MSDMTDKQMMAALQKGVLELIKHRADLTADLAALRAQLDASEHEFDKRWLQESNDLIERRDKPLREYISKLRDYDEYAAIEDKIESILDGRG